MGRCAKACLLIAASLSLGVTAVLLLASAVLPGREATVARFSPSVHTRAEDGLSCRLAACSASFAEAAFAADASETPKARLKPVPEGATADGASDGRSLSTADGFRGFDEQCRPVFATAVEPVVEARPASEVEPTDASQPTLAPPEPRRRASSTPVILIQVEAEQVGGRSH